jgi:hypothetical protein
MKHLSLILCLFALSVYAGPPAGTTSPAAARKVLFSSEVDGWEKGRVLWYLAHLKGGEQAEFMAVMREVIDAPQMDADVRTVATRAYILRSRDPVPFLNHPKAEVRAAAARNVGYGAEVGADEISGLLKIATSDMDLATRKIAIKRVGELSAISPAAADFLQTHANDSLVNPVYATTVGLRKENINTTLAQAIRNLESTDIEVRQKARDVISQMGFHDADKRRVFLTLMKDAGPGARTELINRVRQMEVRAFTELLESDLAPSLKHEAAAAFVAARRHLDKVRRSDSSNELAGRLARLLETGDAELHQAVLTAMQSFESLPPETFTALNEHLGDAEFGVQEALNKVLTSRPVSDFRTALNQGGDAQLAAAELLADHEMGKDLEKTRDLRTAVMRTIADAKGTSANETLIRAAANLGADADDVVSIHDHLQSPEVSPGARAGGYRGLAEGLFVGATPTAVETLLQRKPPANVVQAFLELNRPDKRPRAFSTLEQSEYRNSMVARESALWLLDNAARTVAERTLVMIDKMSSFDDSLRERLLKVLKEGTPSEKAAALRTLVREFPGEAGLGAAVLEVFKDPSGRTALIARLAEIPPDHFRRLGTPEERRELVAQLVNSADGATSVETLRRLLDGDPSLALSVEQAETLLKNIHRRTDKPVRALLTELAVRMPALRPLLTPVANEPPPVEDDTPKTRAEWLERFRQDPDAGRRRRAAQVLNDYTTVNTATLEAFYEQMISDPDPEVRSLSAKGVAKFVESIAKKRRNDFSNQLVQYAVNEDAPAEARRKAAEAILHLEEGNPSAKVELAQKILARLPADDCSGAAESVKKK